MEAIAANQPRILLTLATGTVKTFIAFQIAWELFQLRIPVSTSGVPPYTARAAAKQGCVEKRALCVGAPSRIAGSDSRLSRVKGAPGIRRHLRQFHQGAVLVKDVEWVEERDPCEFAENAVGLRDAALHAKKIDRSALTARGVSGRR